MNITKSSDKYNITATEYVNKELTYTKEQKNYKDVENYKYTLNFNPNMWIPYGVETID